jgi:hypothetical protein
MWFSRRRQQPTTLPSEPRIWLRPPRSTHQVLKKYNPDFSTRVDLTPLYNDSGDGGVRLDAELCQDAGPHGSWGRGMIIGDAVPDFWLTDSTTPSSGGGREDATGEHPASSHELFSYRLLPAVLQVCWSQAALQGLVSARDTLTPLVTLMDQLSAWHEQFLETHPEAKHFHRDAKAYRAAYGQDPGYVPQATQAVISYLQQVESVQATVSDIDQRLRELADANEAARLNDRPEQVISLQAVADRAEAILQAFDELRQLHAPPPAATPTAGRAEHDEPSP